MRSSKKSFEVSLKNEVERIAKRIGLPEDKAFIVWFATEILELSEDEAREAISIEGANDKGIDLLFIEEDDRRIIVVQCKFSPTLSYNGKEREVATLESSLNWLAQPESLKRDGKSELAEAAGDYIAAVKEGFSVELWYVYTGNKSANVDKHIAVYNQNPEHISNRRSIRHYPLDILKATWEEVHGTPLRISNADLQISPGCHFQHDGTFGEALVATIPAKEIIKLYATHGERLFDRNVRLFLGAKGPVNAAIAATLIDETERGNFWAYNNGITILCDSFQLSKDTVRVKNFSIVNGCQTTVSLAQAPTAPDDLKVLVRFIAASTRIVDDVIRFTNSQNSIRSWDIASQDKTQRRLKKQLQNDLSKPYIYLTRRGDRPSGDLKKYKEKGKLRQIKIDVAGQYAAAFRGDPLLAWKHKASIFTKSHDDAFPPDVRPEEVLFQWICGETCREVVTAEIASLRAEDMQVRILTKGGTLFVLAALARIAQLRNGPTYLKSITEERASSNAARPRLKKYANYALTQYVDAVATLTENSGQELHTLIRQKDFWGKVTDRIERGYKKDSIAKAYIEEALPKLH